jgi:hypothetical protein
MIRRCELQSRKVAGEKSDASRRGEREKARERGEAINAGKEHP